MSSAPPVLPPKRRRSFASRAFATLGMVLGALLFLLVIGLIIENWRGKRAWNSFKALHEAQGERFHIEDFIPPSVPPEQNFAMTPFLAPLLDYGPGRPVTWRDPDGRARADELGSVLKGERENPAPSPGNWDAGIFINLDRWGAFFSGRVDGPAPSEPAGMVLAGLAPLDPILTELHSASSRPHSVFPIHYDENFNALLPHLSILKSAAQVARLRALARLSLGKKDEALQDVMLSFRVGESVRGEPLLISQLVRIAIHQLALQPVWEGLARREWTEAQLRDLQYAIASIQLLPDYGRAMRGERAFNNELFERLRNGRLNRAELMSLEDAVISPKASRFLPSGWFYHNQVVINRLHQKYTLPTIDPDKRRAYPDKAARAENIPELKTFTPYNLFARLLLPAIGKSASKFAKTQTSLDLAAVACALERHQLARGSYPERIEALVPEFIASLPNDIISGELLRYSRTGDGRFVLYSVGWNQSDDGGEPRLRKSGDATDLEEGDWVWHYPAR